MKADRAGLCDEHMAEVHEPKGDRVTTPHCTCDHAGMYEALMRDTAWHSRIALAAIAWVDAVRDPEATTLDIAAKATLVIAAVGNESAGGVDAR